LPNPRNHPTDLSVALSKLKSLHCDADGVADVVSVGERAIPALKSILFERESSGLHQVRCRAVEALGLLGAFDVLDGFLRDRTPADDPVERLGDDVVISAAARVIARAKDERTFALLYELAARRPLAGLIAALASFQRPEAIPILINALGEDEVRLAAKTALASYGSAARPFLLDAADHLNSIDDLSESQLRECRSIVSLLGDIDLDSADVKLLRPFMTNGDAQVSALACRVALRSGSRDVRLDARVRLTHLRSRVPWLERLQIDQYLASAPD
jgi:HEAT repeat protein